MDSPDSTTPSSSTSKLGGGGQSKKLVNEGLKNALEPGQKDGSSSATPNDRCASPEPNCVICLEKVQNKSFADACFHQFCYDCILEWSKVKAECPLCKQSFKSIIHSVVSMDDYQQYWVPPPPPNDVDDGSSDDDFMRSLRLYDWGLLPSSQEAGDSLPAATAFAQRLRTFRQRSFLTYHNYFQPGGTSGSSSSSRTAGDVWGNFDPFQFRRFAMDQHHHQHHQQSRSSSTSNSRAYNSAMRRVFEPESNDTWHVCQRNCPVHGNSEQRPDNERDAEADRTSVGDDRRRRETSNREFRRSVYVGKLRAKTPPSDSRIRSTDPNFFSCNPACVHRLVPWLNRELSVLLEGREDQISKVLKEILALIKQVPIKSREFYYAIRHHLSARTNLFAHEFANFAASPHENITSWDRSVQHERRRVQESPLADQDDLEDSNNDSSDSEEFVVDGDRASWPFIWDADDYDQWARERRRRNEAQDGNNDRNGDERPSKSRQRRREASRPRDQKAGKVGDGASKRRSHDEEERMDEGQAVTPLRMTGRERTPVGDERRQTNESTTRNGHRPPTPVEPSRKRYSTNTSPATPDDPSRDSPHGPNLYSRMTGETLSDLTNSVSECGWDTPPLVSTLSRFSRWSDASPTTSEPKMTDACSPSPSDVEVVGMVKAMADRTPIEVTLSSDDDDETKADPDPDIIVERRKRSRPATEGEAKMGGRRIGSRSRLNRPSVVGDVVVDVEMEDEARFLSSRWSTASSSSSSSSSNKSATTRERRRGRRRSESSSESVPTDVTVSSDVESKKPGTNAEVVLGDSDYENDDDDVIIESDGPSRRGLSHVGPIVGWSDENSRSSSSSSTQTSAAPISASVLKAKVWDFLESTRREREMADRAKTGRKENWDAEQEEEATAAAAVAVAAAAPARSSGAKRKRGSSAFRGGDDGNREKSPSKRKSSFSAKGKGKGKGKSSSRRNHPTSADAGGGGVDSVGDSASETTRENQNGRRGDDENVTCIADADADSNADADPDASASVATEGSAESPRWNPVDKLETSIEDADAGEEASNPPTASSSASSSSSSSSSSSHSPAKLKSVVAVSHLNGKKHKRKKERDKDRGKSRKESRKWR